MVNATASLNLSKILVDSSRKICGSQIKMSETSCCLRGYGPFLGEHTDDVLAHILGYSEVQIKDLYGNKVIYHEPAVDRLEKEQK